MKQTLLALVLILSTSIFAQEKPKVISAVIAYDGSDLANAKRYIDEAEEIIAGKNYNTGDEKTLAKFFFYKGEIYLGILFSKDEAVAEMKGDALEKAEDGYMRLLELEKNAKKKKYTPKAAGKIPYLSNAYANKGIELNSAGDFVGAKNAFLRSVEIGMMPELGAAVRMDTNVYFNAGVMAMKAKDYTASAEVFEKVLELGYNGYTFSAVLPDGQEMGIPSKEIPNMRAAQMLLDQGQIAEIKRSESMRKSVYYSLISTYQLADNKEKFNETLAKARTEYPNDIELIKQEIQQYLNAKDYDKAIAMLDEAISKDPTNKLYYNVKGNVLQNQMDDIEGAKAAYEKALEIDPEYGDVLYMSGLIEIENANNMAEEINALPLSAKTKYKELKGQQENYFKAALGYFERAYAVNPDDKDTVKALKEVYYKLGNSEKALEMNKKLQSM